MIDFIRRLVELHDDGTLTKGEVHGAVLRRAAEAFLSAEETHWLAGGAFSYPPQVRRGLLTIEISGQMLKVITHGEAL